MDFKNFLPIKRQFFFLTFDQRGQIRWQKIKCFMNFNKKIKRFMNFIKKKLLLRCPKLMGIAKRWASHSKIMFYRDTKTFVIHISRGTCTRGDIVITISFALAQRNSQWGSKKVIVIIISRRTCVHGDIVIHITFAHARDKR